MKYIVDVNGERVVVELDGAHADVDGVRVPASLSSIEGTPVRLVRIGEQVHRLVATVSMALVVVVVVVMHAIQL